MTTHDSLFTHLTDEQLLAEVQRLAAAERHATARLIRALMELDTRRLYLGEGCSSLFTYCTQVLRLDEAAAYNRIEVARAARRCPGLLAALDEGALTLAAARLLAPHVTAETQDALVAAARHKSKREVERLVAALTPKPDAPVVIRRVPAASAEGTTAAAIDPCAARADASVAAVPALTLTASAARTPAARASGRPPTATMLAPGRVKLQVTISEATHEKLRRARDLLRHAIPTGDVAAVLDRALTLLVEDLERRRAGAASRTQAARGGAPGARHIPAHVRRAVWQRDQGRCAFVGARGRCTERAFLEFHHVQPHAAAGAATVDNVQVRCRAHNQHEAALFFGVDGSDCVREARASYGA